MHIKQQTDKNSLYAVEDCTFIVYIFSNANSNTNCGKLQNNLICKVNIYGNSNSNSKCEQLKNNLICICIIEQLIQNFIKMH